MRVSGSCVAFLNNRTHSCFLRIVFVRRKIPMSPMFTRRKDGRRHDQTRCLQDGLTKGMMDSRIQYENAPSRGLPGIFLHAKDFAPLTKLLPDPEKDHRRPYDGLRCPHEWPGVFTIRAEFENVYHRVSILCQLRDCVTPALQNLEIGL